MRECDGRRENERKKKVSVRIEKGRKGGKNRVGNRQARDKEKRDRSGHILSRKGKILEFGINWDNVCSPNCAIS